ncbi:hypothetical protein TBLA_0B07620 [Henningerozyma blattae CBS 6284]|uniref:Rhodanese domain-containing protein n=1 Tax=Henningerozyma blattae (strain ATCC 34711 / CBS 6284 / DSM 70876 / NBRC 10599 / NRRL Y-10934 / UCD 77-7) TaxID=1071380 RepID=I2GZM6_HENB6|nr:hypothetical protein TBLA_0B07620 [Tetrapisispora blattae CBS 6284]CCH59578.1 hypothetical protein TBLA_0B07620 [Tetrapisispora blattae CBS 6284]
MQRSISNIKYIDAHTLSKWILSSSISNYQVIDVRGSDYIGGHIHNSWNVPYRKMNHDTLQELIVKVDKQTELDSHKPYNVIFHCAHSQQRGPSAALKFLRLLSDEQLSYINVMILRGGFVNWAYEYGKNNQLTDDFVADLWTTSST